MSSRQIEILSITPLYGPNMWTYFPALEALVDIGELEDSPSNTIPGFYERLSAWVPSLIEHRCSYDERGGFLRRVQEGTWPGHILEHVTLELQNLAGMKGGFGRAREVSRRGVYKVIVSTWQEDVTRAALYAARDLVMAAIEDRPFDVADTVSRLRDLAERRLLGPSTASIVEAAEDRRIPYTRLNDGNLVQFGYGAKQRRIWTAETDRTSAIAETISCDKSLTKSLLRSCGVPTPEGEVVETADAAWETAQDIGLPVVVKPSDGNHGRAVFTNLTTQVEVETAFAVAQGEGSEVLVERFIPGDEHRLLVVGGKLVAAAKGESAWVVGDGQSTIRDLIESQLNSDPRRGYDEEQPLNPVRIDSAATLELKRQGYDGDSVPAAGVRVLVQRNGNVAFDVTDDVHPQNAALVALAAKVVGLDIAGIDLVAEDISRPLAEQGGAIVEVNAGPGLLMHLKPASGQPRPVGRAIVDSLFAPGENGRIPVIGVTGSNGTTLAADLIARLVQLSGRYVGLACREGLYHNRRRVESGDRSGYASARKLLLSPAIEAAVFENDLKVIATEGLAYDRCQVGVVTDIAADEALPEAWIETPQQVYNVFRSQVDVVLSGGVAVLNADDTQVAEMAELCDGDVVWFGQDEEGEKLAEARAAGQRVVFRRKGRLVFVIGAEETVLSGLVIPPVLAEQPVALLAAAAAAWALGMQPKRIGAGIESFALD